MAGAATERQLFGWRITTASLARVKFGWASTYGKRMSLWIPAHEVRPSNARGRGYSFVEVVGTCPTVDRYRNAQTGVPSDRSCPSRQRSFFEKRQPLDGL